MGFLNGFFGYMTEIKSVVNTNLPKNKNDLLTLMLTEGQVYFVSPQNSAGVSQENNVAESPKQWK